MSLRFVARPTQTLSQRERASEIADSGMLMPFKRFRPSSAPRDTWLKPGVNETKHAKDLHAVLRQSPQTWNRTSLLPATSVGRYVDLAPGGMRAPPERRSSTLGMSTSPIVARTSSLIFGRVTIRLACLLIVISNTLRAVRALPNDSSRARLRS